MRTLDVRKCASTQAETIVQLKIDVFIGGIVVIAASTEVFVDASRGQSAAQSARDICEYAGMVGEPLQYGSDNVLSLLTACSFRQMSLLDFDGLALAVPAHARSSGRVGRP